MLRRYIGTLRALLLRDITKSGTWLHTHPWTVVAFLLGTGVGILIFHFVVGSSSVEALAAVIGAVLGSAVTVWGAIWVTHRQEAKDKEALKLAIVVLASPFETLVDDLFDLMKQEEREIEKEIFKVRSLNTGVPNTIEQLRLLQPLFYRNAVKAIDHQQLVGAFEKVRPFLAMLCVPTTLNMVKATGGWGDADFETFRKNADTVLQVAERMTR